MGTRVGGEEARALSLAASCGNRAAQALVGAYEALCRGQMLEIVKLGDWQRSVDEYFAATTGKAGETLDSPSASGRASLGH